VSAGLGVHRVSAGIDEYKQAGLSLEMWGARHSALLYTTLFKKLS
jgi:hypothetical protein